MLAFTALYNCQYYITLHYITLHRPTCPITILFRFMLDALQQGPRSMLATASRPTRETNTRVTSSVPQAATCVRVGLSTNRMYATSTWNTTRASTSTRQCHDVTTSVATRGGRSHSARKRVLGATLSSTSTPHKPVTGASTSATFRCVHSWTASNGPGRIRRVSADVCILLNSFGCCVPITWTNFCFAFVDADVLWITLLEIDCSDIVIL